MPSILDEIVAHKRLIVQDKMNAQPLAILEERLAMTPPAIQFSGFPLKSSGRPAFILEVKPASPSEGVLNSTFDVESTVSLYNQYASAISVLTDEKYFSGSFDLLRAVVEKSRHPVLCKDFILTRYQLYEACCYGASWVLLIVKILSDAELLELYEQSLALGLLPVIEVQDEHECERALAVGAKVVLINNRNLTTFEIDLDTTARLSAFISNRASEPVELISASGLVSFTDIQRVAPYCQAVLMGSVIMKSASMSQTLAQLAGEAV